MASEKPILYSYWRSSCSWRVRVVLNLKGIEYETRAISLLKKEQNAQDYLKLNPQGLVPCFIHNGNAISESIAIMEYLEEAYPNTTPILPKDILKKATVRNISLQIAAGIQPLQNLSVISHEIIGEKKMEWAKFWINKGFVSLEERLSKTAGKFCVGDEITMADACLVPQIYNANRFNVDMSQFPIISRIGKACAEVKAFIAADPENQPDKPQDP